MAKPQNIYDNDEFFEKYRNLRENDTGMNDALEIPAVRSVLPQLNGARVLDLGAGFGDFARWVRTQGASHVVAVDVSDKMIEQARSLASDPEIEYIVSSLEDYLPEEGVYDLAIASLVLHYINEYETVVKRVHNALKPGGEFVFTVEHPIRTALRSGWAKEGIVVDRYFDETERSTTWFIDNIIKYHRTIGTYVSVLLKNGFELTNLVEPQPIAERRTQLGAKFGTDRCPAFLLISARRQK